MHEQKVIFCDIDDVLTFDKIVDGKKQRIIDLRAIARIKKLVARGFKIAFVTGKAADFVQRDFIPVLEKFGIADKCLVYGEHGFYEISGNTVRMLSEAKRFLSERNLLLAEIESALKKKGIEYYFPEEETKQVTLYFKLKNPSLENQKTLQETIQQVIGNLRARGQLTHELVVNLTKSGCDVYPATTSKGNAVLDALRKWGLAEGSYRGRAYGDMPGDIKMAPGPKIRFYLITGKSQNFLKETSFLRLKFWGRKMRGIIAMKEREMPPNRLMRKVFRTVRRVLPK